MEDAPFFRQPAGGRLLAQRVLALQGRHCRFQCVQPCHRPLLAGGWRIGHRFHRTGYAGSQLQVTGANHIGIAAHGLGLGGNGQAWLQGGVLMRIALQTLGPLMNEDNDIDRPLRMQ